MSLKSFELDVIKKVFNIGETNQENLAEKLPADIYDFLKKNDNLKTIIDRLIYRPKTKYRPFDNLIVTKFLSGDLNLKKKFEEIFENISGNFLLYLDFHFIILVKSENHDRVFKFEHASKASALNETYKIVTNKDVEDFLEELNAKTLSDFLNDSFVNHRDLFAYQGSGFTPFMLLSLVFTVQKLM